MEENLLTYDEAAAKAKVSVRSLMRLKVEGKVRSYQPMRGVVRFLWSELVEDMRSVSKRDLMAEGGPPLEG